MPAALPCAAQSEGGDEPASAATEFDDYMTALFQRMAQRPEQRVPLREQMIETSLSFAVRLARHYQGRGEPFEDLVQVATVGLIKAIDGYDPERGPFSHYAGPTIRGELKKHFRDRGWSVRVPRRLQELKMEMSRAHQVLTHALGRAPTVTDLARYLGVDVSRLLAQTLAWLRAAMSEDTIPDWPGLTAPTPATPAGALQIDVQRLPGGTVLVVVAGEVDHDSAAELRATLCEAAIADRPWRVRTDLAQVPLMDAAGAAALVAGRRAAQHSGADFILERARRPVVEVLCRAGLGGVFGLTGVAPVQRVVASAAHTTLPC